MKKVFGIGFNKTGTSTLGVALEQLGYRVCHGARPIRRRLGPRRTLDLLQQRQFDEIVEIAGDYDAAEDNPWFVLYRELDRRFEDSRFILTIRDASRWLESAVGYYGRSESPLRQWIYGAGSPVGHQPRWLERYQRHNQEVAEYFARRPNDLLVVDWERGAAWPEICRFLGHEIPAGPFPHVRPVRSPSGT